jgi:hypothetical protein
VRLTAQISASDIAKAGTAEIVVFTPAPGGGASDVAFFSITTPSTDVTLSAVGLPFFGISFVADLRSKGKLDLISDSGVSLGNGDGSFQPPISLPLPPPSAIPTYFGVADFNGDGKPDIVGIYSGSFFGTSPGLLLGNGDGTFQTPITSSGTNDEISDCDIGDFDQDGNLDIVCIGFNIVRGIQELNFFPGRGDGSFQNPTFLAISSASFGQLLHITTGDFNQDGRLDILGVYDSGDVAVFLGNGDGTFQGATGMGGVPSESIALIADFNGDGIPDIVHYAAENGSRLSTAVAVGLGTGSGLFKLPYTFLPPSGPGSSMPEDLDADGTPDLILMNVQSNALLLARGNGDGTFQVPQQIKIPANPFDATAEYVPLIISRRFQGAWDFNGDGKPDLLAFDPNALSVNSFLLIQGTLGSGSLSALSGSFEIAPVGTNALVHVPFVFGNTGAAPISVTGITISGANATDFSQTNNCAGSLPPGNSCQITVQFTPAVEGLRLATLNVANTGTLGVSQVPLSGTGTDFFMSQTQSTVTIKAGQTATFNFVLGSKTGFPFPLSVSCTGAPTASLCMAPSEIFPNETPKQSPTPFAVTVATIASSTSAGGLLDNSRGHFALWMIGLPAAILIGSSGRKRNRRSAKLLLVTLSLLATSCGSSGIPSGSSGIPKVQGTPPGSYNLTITATFTSGGKALAHSSNVTLVVQ